MYDVTRELIVNAKRDFHNLYAQRVLASDMLNSVNSSQLMQEVQGLLQNDPFNTRGG